MNTHEKHPQDHSERNNRESDRKELKKDPQVQNSDMSGEEVRGDTWEDRDRILGSEAGAESNFPADVAQVDRMGNPTEHDESDF